MYYSTFVTDCVLPKMYEGRRVTVDALRYLGYNSGRKSIKVFANPISNPVLWLLCKM